MPQRHQARCPQNHAQADRSTDGGASSQAKPADKPYRLADGKGLYLEVKPNGSRYWGMKYRFDGKEKRAEFGV